MDAGSSCSCYIQIKKFKIEKVLSAYSGRERKENSNRCIGKKSSLHIAPSPDENKKVKPNWASSPVQMTEQDMINILVDAGYAVQKMNKGV